MHTAVLAGADPVIMLTARGDELDRIVGLELGAVFLQPIGAAFASKAGLQAGVGIQVPLFPRATGPVIGLHGGARWSDSVLAGRDIESSVDRSMFLLVTAGWQHVFSAHIVDLGDRAP